MPSDSAEAEEDEAHQQQDEEGQQPQQQRPQQQPSAGWPDVAAEDAEMLKLFLCHDTFADIMPQGTFAAFFGPSTDEATVSWAYRALEHTWKKRQQRVLHNIETHVAETRNMLRHTVQGGGGEAAPPAPPSVVSWPDASVFSGHGAQGLRDVNARLQDAIEDLEASTAVAAEEMQTVDQQIQSRLAELDDLRLEPALNGRVQRLREAAEMVLSRVGQ